jgi:hypothetical protein
MSTCYEFALNCDLKSGVSQEIIDTLTYMTRSGEDESEFETTIDHPLFVTEVIDFGEGDEYFSDWKFLIQNKPTYGDEMIMSGIAGSIFRDLKLGVRQFLHDDLFFNKFHLLLDWLVSICESDGFIGYYIGYDSSLSRGNDLTLIYFINGKVFEKFVDKNSMVSVFDDD